MSVNLHHVAEVKANQSDDKTLSWFNIVDEDGNSVTVFADPKLMIKLANQLLTDAAYIQADRLEE
jgi:hypothetical protein